jgi:hypothetical protein
LYNEFDTVSENKVRIAWTVGIIIHSPFLPKQNDAPLSHFVASELLVLCLFDGNVLWEWALEMVVWINICPLEYIWTIFWF